MGVPRYEHYSFSMRLPFQVHTSARSASVLMSSSAAITIARQVRVECIFTVVNTPPNAKSAPVAGIQGRQTKFCTAPHPLILVVRMHWHHLRLIARYPRLFPTTGSSEEKIATCAPIPGKRALMTTSLVEGETRKFVKTASSRAAAKRAAKDASTAGSVRGGSLARLRTPELFPSESME